MNHREFTFYTLAPAIFFLVGAHSLDVETAPSHGRVADFGNNLAPVVDWGAVFTFVDLMKTSRRWNPQHEGAWDTKEELSLDENGYIKALKPGQWAVTLMANEARQIIPDDVYTFFTRESEVEWGAWPV